MRQDASVSDDIEADVVSDEEVPQRTLGAISFANLDETDFEGFCFDLLIELGFVNVDWRKGTPKWPVRPTAAATLSPSSSERRRRPHIPLRPDHRQ